VAVIDDVIKKVRISGRVLTFFNRRSGLGAVPGYMVLTEPELATAADDQHIPDHKTPLSCYGLGVSPAAYMLVLGHREGVVWVLRNSRMAFPQTHSFVVDHIDVGDELFLLTTRGCWGSPNHHRTRVIGRARVMSPVAPSKDPLEIAGRTLTRSCDIAIEQLVPFPVGVELPPLIPQMDAFPNKNAWSMWLRRTLLRLPPKDELLLREKLDQIASDPAAAIRSYV
jgi:hypothetical protein